MLVKIGQFEITECWDGVFYKTLSHYPDITKWEIQTVLDFERYEEINGRKCGIQAEQKIIERINAYKIFISKPSVSNPSFSRVIISHRYYNFSNAAIRHL